MVWRGISSRCVYGPYFFDDTINSETYQNLIENEFIKDLRKQENLDEIWFQQDNAPPHTSNSTLEKLDFYFEDRIISKKKYIFWPPNSPDINPCDFFLWGFLKSKIYSTEKYKSITALKEKIIDEIKMLNNEKSMLENVIFDFIERVSRLKTKEGGHVEI